MPPRRSHKKSKAGCQRCKQRKIKCDEIHPICGNCAKHGVTCDFEGQPISPTTPATTTFTPPPPVLLRQQSTTETSANSPAGSASASTPRSSASITPITPLYQTPTQLVRTNVHPAASRQLELKLMHHFTANTSLTFSDMDAAQQAWKVDIPTIAYDAPYLMDAILAVSALHLRAQHPNDKVLVRASHGYMASALAQYASLLNTGVSQINAEALFSTSALIAFQASASRRFEDFQGDGGYTLPLAWFHSFQGVKTVVMSSWQWLRQSNRVFPIINGQPALSLDLDPERRLFFAPLLEGLDEETESLPNQISMETRQAYEHSVAFLNWAYLNPTRNRVLGFAATVSRRFVDLLGQHDPRTLLIVSCFFAMIRAFDDVWWLQGIAKREVNGIASLLPSEWWPKMEWALNIANHDGPVPENLWGTTREVKVEEGLDVIGNSNVRDHIDILANIIETYVPLD